MYEVVCATGISRCRRQQLMLKPLPERTLCWQGNLKGNIVRKLCFPTRYTYRFLGQLLQKTNDYI